MFGLLAPPIAWAVLHMFDYLWIETACTAGLLGGTVLGLTGVAWVVLIATMLAVLVSVIAGIGAYRRSRAYRDPEDKDAVTTVEAPSYFVARSGILVSVLFTLLIILTALPVFVMPPCFAVP
jgi:hypothetical protein